MISIHGATNILVENDDITIPKSCIPFLKEHNLKEGDVDKIFLCSLVGDRMYNPNNLQRLASLSILKYTELITLYDILPEHFYYIKSVCAINVYENLSYHCIDKDLFIFYLFILCIEDKLHDKVRRIHNMEWKLLMRYVYDEYRDKESILSYVNNLFVTAKVRLL